MSALKKKNKNFNPNQCPVTHCMNMIGGKWKPVILHLIRKGANRFSILQKAIPAVSRQTLTNQLRELEEDGLLVRTIYAEIPPRVEYTMTQEGLSLLPIIEAMTEWGLERMEKNASDQYCES